MGTRASGAVPSCSRAARAAGDDPIGCEIARAHYLVLEVPLPWGVEVEESRALPAGVRDIVASVEHGSQQLYVLGIAPDPAYSIPGRTRVLSFRRPEGAFVRFERAEYLVTAEALPWLVEALCLRPEHAGRYADYRVDGPPMRDLLVCTHGTQDVCCARFGFPAYRMLRATAGAAGDALRVWRSSHFGGHRFAPVLLEFPEARGWAWLDDAVAGAIVARSGPLPDLRRHYRGWAGLGFFAQVAEREVFAREGWHWLANEVGATITSGDPGERDVYPVFDDDPPPPVGVRLDYRAPDGRAGSWSATVVPRDQVITQGECGYGALPTWRFAVTNLEHTPATVGVSA